MTGGTPEGRRAELVDRLTAAVRGSGSGCIYDPALAAEAVLALLESGDAGVYLVAGGDLQETVGVVLAQVREARSQLASALGDVGRLSARAIRAEAELARLRGAGA